MTQTPFAPAYVAVNLGRCTGCRVCELACSEAKEKAYSPKRSRITVLHTPPTTQVKVCQMCERPACVASCAPRALRKDGDRGIILLDGERCTGCGLCVKGCPFGAVKLHPETKKPLICDLCSGTPRCAEACPERSLSLAPLA